MSVLAQPPASAGAPQGAARAAQGDTVTLPRMAFVHLMDENAQLRAKLGRSEQRWAHTLEWFANPHMKFAPKVVGFNYLIEIGAAPGVLPEMPLTDTPEVSMAVIGHKSACDAKTASVHLDTLRQNGIISFRQQKVRTEERRKAPPPQPKAAGGAPPPPPTSEPRSAAKPEGQPPPFVTVTHALPMEGPDHPILHPAKIGPLQPSSRAVKHRNKEAEKRQDTRKKLDRLKVLEARCPKCGCIDPDQLKLVCDHCGERRHVSELPDAKRTVRWATPRFRRREEPHPIDADGNPIPAPETEHCSSSAAQQQELFPASPAAPIHEETSGAEIRAQKAESLESPQQSGRSAEEQCSPLVETYTYTLPGTVAEHCSSSGAASPEKEQCSSSGAPPVTESQCSAAAEVLLALFGYFDEHITMLQGTPTADGRKYSTVEAPLTKDLLEQHLRGEVTLGGRLALHGLPGPLARAWAWDEDGPEWAGYRRLLAAADRLYEAGLRPVLVQNTSKPGSGHLWVFADRKTDAYRAQRALEKLAPMLQQAKERYPNAKTSTGARIRFPAGVYVTTEGQRVPVKVGVHRGPGDVIWAAGDTPRAWAMLTGALSDARILECTYIPTDLRPAPAPERNNVPRRAPRLAGGDGGIGAWCQANPIDAQVSIEHGSKFYAPWRHESAPSVHYYRDEGRFHDYGDPQYHGDAFDLFMILRGHWDPTQPKGPANPDYKAACRDAGIARDAAGSEAPSVPLPLAADQEDWVEL